VVLFFGCPGRKTPPFDPCSRKGNVAWFCENGIKNVPFLDESNWLKMPIISVGQKKKIQPNKELHGFFQI
jgi:hypothetical protein